MYKNNINFAAYEEYLFETYFIGKFNANTSLEENFEKRLITALANSSMVTESERFLLNDSLNEDYYAMFFDTSAINEWSLFKKAKEKIQKAIEVAKEKGKQALSKGQEILLKIGGGIQGVIKLVLDKVGKVIQAGADKLKGVAKKIADAAKDKAEKSLGISLQDEETTKKIDKDLTQGKTDMGAGAKWCVSGFKKDIATVSVKAAKDEVKEEGEDHSALSMYKGLYEDAFVFIVKNEKISREDLESMSNLVESINDFEAGKINEGDVHIPFLGTLMDKIAKFPPFKWFKKIKEAVQKFGNNVLSKISMWIAKLASGPGPFLYVWLGAKIADLTIGKYLDKFDPKGFVKGAIENIIVAAVPALGVVYKILKYSIITLEYIGMAVAAMAIAVKVLGDKAPKFAKDALGKVENKMKELQQKSVAAQKKKEEEEKSSNENFQYYSTSLKKFSEWSKS